MSQPDHPKLADGARVVVVGGGPAGSFFAHFLLDMAQRVGMNLQVDIYEPRDFTASGPAGCNMCGGVVSESLVQALATEGILLPTTVVQRGIDSYALHMDLGSVHIETPLHEKRIAVVHRGAGPRGVKALRWGSFDSYLLGLAVGKGARLVRRRVDGLAWQDGRPQVKAGAEPPQDYDLLAMAVGVNTAALKLLEGLGFGYRPPVTTKTYICEIYLGQEMVEALLGTSMHVFLLNLPRLEFAALIPKGEYATLCMMGEEIDAALIQSFLDAPEVKQCLPPDWRAPRDLCHCAPRINIGGAAPPFADRIVFIGDCGVTRLYKDGIGAAYRAAKSAAVTAVFDGISADDFRRRYGAFCRSTANDNRIGRLIFAVTGLIQTLRPVRRGVLRMITGEQASSERSPRMSMVMWDLFTGSAPYGEVFLRTLHPEFLGRLAWETLTSLVRSEDGPERSTKPFGSAGG
jgi:flavin-dependent dehydrogenase